MIRFEDAKKDVVSLYLTTQAKEYQSALDATAEVIDGFESPLGMELLATVDWLLTHEKVEPRVGAIKDGLVKWPGGAGAGARKLKLFDDRLINLALSRLAEVARSQTVARVRQE